MPATLNIITYDAIFVVQTPKARVKLNGIRSDKGPWLGGIGPPFGGAGGTDGGIAVTTLSPGR